MALVKHRTPFAPIGLTDTISGRVDFLLEIVQFIFLFVKEFP